MLDKYGIPELRIFFGEHRSPNGQFLCLSSAEKSTVSPLELLGLAIQTWFERLIAIITYQ
jgi:hypothetical protein